VVRFYAQRYAAVTIFSAFLVSGALAAALAIAMVLRRYPPALYAIAHGRATGTFVLPGELAGYLIVLLPIAWTLGSIAKAKSLRAVGWTAFALGIIAIALTFSRAGWMGLAAAFAFLFAVRTRRATTAALLILGGVVAVFVLFNAHHDPSEDYTRFSIWQAAMQIADRFPLTGVGPFNFSRLYTLARAPDADPTAFHAHSLYLTFFVEFGIIGLSAVAWTIWRFAAELQRRIVGAADLRGYLAASVAAGLVGVAVQGLIDTVSVVIFGLWMPTMGLALAAADGGEPDPATEESCAVSIS
jgi:putative inorganic carbon (hco3(-)) transporter